MEQPSSQKPATGGAAAEAAAVAGAASTATASTSTAASSVPPPKPKGYTNPALQAMGIPRLRLPSRNWSIFWAVVGGVSGLIIYDRLERKNRRQFWKDQVSFLGEVPLNATELPRKIKVYMAPPPNDYLEVTQQHFRQYIKPILTAAAVDYEIHTESRQGEIRALVAEEARNKRRVLHNLPVSESDSNKNKDELDLQIERGITRDNTGGVICIGRGAYKEYLNGLQEGWLGPLDPPPEPVQEEVAKTADSELITDSATTTTTVPIETLDEQSKQHQVVTSQIPTASTSTKEQEDAASFPNAEEDERDVLGYKESDEAEAKAAKEQQEKEGDSEKKGESEDDEKDKRPPVTKPYILGMNRGAKVWGPEITTESGADADLLAAKPEDISDPIAILEHRHVLGFLHIPIRIVRFFSRRELADEMGKATANAVFNVYRPFYNGTSSFNDTTELITDKVVETITETEQQQSQQESKVSKIPDTERLIIEETEDWSSKWKQKAVNNNSEWIWPFSVDDRIANKLRVYDITPELESKFAEANKNYSAQKKLKKEAAAAAAAIEKKEIQERKEREKKQIEEELIE